jgi:hypothetical protein
VTVFGDVRADPDLQDLLDAANQREIVLVGVVISVGQRYWFQP